MTETVPTVPTVPTDTATHHVSAIRGTFSRPAELQTGTIGTVGTIAKGGRLLGLQLFGNAQRVIEPLETIEPKPAIDIAFDELDPSEIETCQSCDDLCDIQTLDDAWHCSCCDPNADARRKRTLRLLESAKRIRNETGTL